MSALLSANARFERVIVKDFYDGPLSGIAMRPDGEWMYFQAVAWDAEQDQRVFAIRAANPDHVAALIGALAAIESPHTPFWLAGPNTGTDANERLWKAVATSSAVPSLSLIEGTSPLTATVEERLDASEAVILDDWLQNQRFIEVMSGSVIRAVREMLRQAPD